MQIYVTGLHSTLKPQLREQCGILENEGRIQVVSPSVPLHFGGLIEFEDEISHVYCQV